MSLKALCRGLLAVVVLAALAGGAIAQNVYYNEVTKDGRIYVFASGARYDAFQRSQGTEIGQAFTRPGYGPNGETVVFDSEDAINLYNFKHNLPGEYFPKPKEAPKPSTTPRSAVGTTIFADYTYQDAPKITDADKNSVQLQQLRSPPGLHQRNRQHQPMDRLPRHARRRRPPGDTVRPFRRRERDPARPRREPRLPAEVRLRPVQPRQGHLDGTWIRFGSSRLPTSTGWRGSTATGSRGRSSSSVTGT